MTNLASKIATIINSIPTTTDIQVDLEDITIGAMTIVASVWVKREELDIGHGETKPHWIIMAPIFEGEIYQYVDHAAEAVQRASIAGAMAIQ